MTPTSDFNLDLFDSTTQQNIKLWLEGNYDETSKQAIRSEIQINPKAVLDAFYTTLSFGTGGLRGLTGEFGFNRMNKYTVGMATQGLANYLNALPNLPTKRSVCIGYDSRNQSKYFAEECSKVLAANNFTVYLLKELRPTPLVSFLCRKQKSMAAIVITASHNPPEYNGYKVYWNDGAQLLPPHDKGILAEIKKITNPDLIKTTQLTNPLIHILGEEIDDAYLNATYPLQFYPNDNKTLGKTLRVTYTNLHGTGITLVPKILAKWGFSDLSFVETQKEPDGNFPTVKSPNPEEKKALQLGINEMIKSKTDLLLATDPDADRMGVVVNHHGSPVLLNGNQIACILLEHICQAHRDHNDFPKKPAFIKTIVTTELFKTIVESYRATCFDVLTGFKYIAEKINEWENSKNGYQFVFGGEESYGYLLGTQTRDKDAVIACALMCEVALQAKMHHKDLIDLLHEIYEKYGVHSEGLLSVNFAESKEGKEQMDKAMRDIRTHSPKSICGIPVQAIEDYLTSKKSFVDSNKTENLTLPISNVLLFWLADGSKLVIRPSGTEPKIKLYCGIVENRQNLSNDEKLSTRIANCDDHANNLLKAMESLLKLTTK